MNVVFGSFPTSTNGGSASGNTNVYETNVTVIVYLVGENLNTNITINDTNNIVQCFSGNSGEVTFTGIDTTGPDPILIQLSDGPCE
jgi:hypothetical protein